MSETTEAAIDQGAPLNPENPFPMPKTLGNMRLYWYDVKTGVPRIAVGNKYMLLGSIPLAILGMGALVT